MDTHIDIGVVARRRTRVIRGCTVLRHGYRKDARMRPPLSQRNYDLRGARLTDWPECLASGLDREGHLWPCGSRDSRLLGPGPRPGEDRVIDALIAVHHLLDGELPDRPFPAAAAVDEL
jgi:hypothetical protein